MDKIAAAAKFVQVCLDVREIYPRTINPRYLSNMEDDSGNNARRGKKGITPEQVALRDRVMSFFRRLQTDLGLSGLTKEVFGELVGHINREIGEDRFHPSVLRRFQQREPAVRQELFERIMLAIPAVAVWQKHPGVRRLYEEVFQLKFSELAPDRAIFNFQRDDRRPLTELDNILGDYLLYRSEAVSGRQDHLISRSFFRFYQHRNGHIRSMGLWLDEGHDYLSSKGWVVNPDNYHLVVGHVVDRVGARFEDIRRGGGATMMTIRHSEPNRYTIINPESGVPRIQCAPVMHFRATNSTEPSFSKGVLVRLYGVEGLGGGPNTAKSKRYDLIRGLQEKLSAKCKRLLTLSQAATQLAAGTGFKKDVFYQKSGDDGLPSGLLVNRPTLRITSGRDDDPLSELVLGASGFQYHSTARLHTQRPREAAGINFDDISA